MCPRRQRHGPPGAGLPIGRASRSRSPCGPPPRDVHASPQDRQPRIGTLKCSRRSAVRGPGRRRSSSTDCDGSTPGCSSRASSGRCSAASATGADWRPAASSSPIRSERPSALLRHRAQPQTRTRSIQIWTHGSRSGDPPDPEHPTPRRARVSRSLTGSRGAARPARSTAPTLARGRLLIPTMLQRCRRSRRHLR